MVSRLSSNELYPYPNATQYQDRAPTLAKSTTQDTKPSNPYISFKNPLVLHVYNQNPQERFGFVTLSHVFAKNTSKTRLTFDSQDPRCIKLRKQ